jgi:hypothetical protein
MSDTRTKIIAAACHSAWYAYTVLALGEPGEPWTTAPEWQKSSILHAVAFWDALDTDALPFEKVCAASHVAWMKERTRGGWIYGTVKDPEKKTHPCLVPYEELPEAQRKKDAVVVQTYLALRSLVPSDTP